MQTSRFPLPSHHAPQWNKTLSDASRRHSHHKHGQPRKRTRRSKPRSGGWRAPADNNVTTAQPMVFSGIATARDAPDPWRVTWIGRSEQPGQCRSHPYTFTHSCCKSCVTASRAISQSPWVKMTHLRGRQASDGDATWRREGPSLPLACLPCRCGVQCIEHDRAHKCLVTSVFSAAVQHSDPQILLTRRHEDAHERLESAVPNTFCAYVTRS